MKSTLLSRIRVGRDQVLEVVLDYMQGIQVDMFCENLQLQVKPGSGSGSLRCMGLGEVMRLIGMAREKSHMRVGQFFWVLYYKRDGTKKKLQKRVKKNC